jgi:hypothetical protein
MSLRDELINDPLNRGYGQFVFALILMLLCMTGCGAADQEVTMQIEKKPVKN